jgi:hypothetical protein
VIGVLKAAFMQGMLAKDEFDLRAGQRPRERGRGRMAWSQRRGPLALMFHVG